jgi:transposase-like protein
MPNTPNPGERGRFSAPRKAATVLRLLRGESLEILSRELGVTTATLAGWSDDFLAGGQAALKSRPTDDRDDEIARLRAKVGELTMDNELLIERCQADLIEALREFKQTYNEQWQIQRRGYRSTCQVRRELGGGVPKVA